MKHSPEGSLDVTGKLAVATSAMAVLLVVVAIVTDEPLLLAMAAIVVAGAIALTIGRQTASRREANPAVAPTNAATIGCDGHREDVVGTDPEDDESAAERYRGEAVTARADLLATLRHGFRTDAARDRSSAGTEAATDPQIGADGNAGSSSTSLAAPGPRGDSVDGPPSSSPPDPAAAGGEADPLFDPASGLFTQGFFEASLPKRVSAARRGLRPLSVAAIDVVAGRPVAGATAADRAVVAAVMTDVFRDADTIAIAHDGRFLVLLEDTPEAGAVWTLERLRRQLTAVDPDHTMWAGVSCYPAYSFDADGLTSQAREALESARQWQQDRIEITAHEPE